MIHQKHIASLPEMRRIKEFYLDPNFSLAMYEVLLSAMNPLNPLSSPSGSCFWNG